MVRTHWLVLASIATLFLAQPARAGRVVDAEWLAVRLLTAEPSELAGVLRDYDTLEPADRTVVLELLEDAHKRPEGLADRLIDLAIASEGAPRARLLRALHRLGDSALERFLERAKSARDGADQEVPPAKAPPAPNDLRPLIQIECRLLQARTGTFDSILTAGIPTPEHTHRAIETQVAEALLARAPADVQILHAPRLTTFDGQSANLTATNEVSYVRDYQVKKDEKGRVVLDPVVATIKDGLVVDLEPTLRGERIALNVLATVADLARPIAEFEQMFGGQSARIQIPELHVSRVRAQLDLPNGGYALVGGFSSTDESERVLLVKVERVPVTPR